MQKGRVVSGGGGWWVVVVGVGGMQSALQEGGMGEGAWATAAEQAWTNEVLAGRMGWKWVKGEWIQGRQLQYSVGVGSA